MRLADLDAGAREQLSQLTLAAEWIPDLDAARDEIADALAPGKVALVAVGDAGPMGWVAASHAWGRIWELHPLIVGIEYQRRGIGRELVRDVERIAAVAGALTMMLGTSDTTGATSLSDVDLYEDTFERIGSIAMRKPHALGFWLRVGYRVVGVVPDAEGPAKPSITLARRLA